MSKKDTSVNDDWDDEPVTASTPELKPEKVKQDAFVLRVERYSLDNNVGRVKAREVIRNQDLLEKVGKLKSPIKAQESLVITREVLIEMIERLL